MVKAGPQGAARAVEHSYIYVVSDEFIQERVELEGIEPSKKWTIAFSLQDLPDPGTRARALNLRSLYRSLGQEPELERPTDDAIEFLDQLEDWLTAEEELISYEEGETRQREQEREREARQFDEAMDLWISQYGSYRLKTARAKWYKVTSSYAKARGRKELPGFWVDTADIAEFRERVDPSAEALRAETAVEELLARKAIELQTRVIWLVEPPSGLAERYEDPDLQEVLGEDWEFPQQEAVLVPGYLGRYQAFLLIDAIYQAPLQDEEEE